MNRAEWEKSRRKIASSLAKRIAETEAAIKQFHAENELWNEQRGNVSPVYPYYEELDKYCLDRRLKSWM